METQKQNEPIKPKITANQLATCGYDAILAKDTDGEYSIMDGLLSQEAITAQNAGEVDRAAALTFLAQVSSMMLTPAQKTTPFQPLIRWADGRRSMIPEDLSVEEIELLANIASEVKHAMLRARIADLVWMKSRRRDIKFVMMAIDAYCQHPIDKESWHMSGEKCWHRALQLALSLGKGAGSRVTDIESVLIAAFWRVANAEDFEPLWYVNPLYLEGRAKAEASKIAAQYEQLGHKRMNDGRASEAQDFFESAERWYVRAHLPDKQVEMLTLIASSWSAQGDNNKSALARHHFYTKAIATYRHVPASHRNEYQVDEHIDTLRAKLTVAGSMVLGEMKTVRGPKIDLADIAAEANELVKEKAPIDALLTFCNLHPIPNKAQLYTQSENSLTDSIVGRLFNSTSFSNDGRVIAKLEAASTGAEAQDAAVKAGAIMACLRVTAVTVHGMIEPALDTMQIEGLLDLRDFRNFAYYSSLVPRDRVDIVAKALYAGYCRDYEQAIHILAPQFEHMVRMALKDAGSHTTTHDSEGIDMETGLSTLIDRPQMEAVFGEDLTFTIRAIMCDQQGPNLRNAVAHGLADSVLCNSTHSVYAWWLILRLVTQSFVIMRSFQNEQQ